MQPSLISESGIPLSAQIVSILGQNISYPDPILLLAFVHSDLMVTGMNVAATIIDPVGAAHAVLFTDDGVAPDAYANDGLYSAIVPYTTDGIYTIESALTTTRAQQHL